MVLKPVLKEFHVNGNNLQQKRHGEAVFVEPEPEPQGAETFGQSRSRSWSRYIEVSGFRLQLRLQAPAWVR